MSNSSDDVLITICEASLEEAEEILEIQKIAFWGQAKIYNNFKLPPLLQSIESLRNEFKHKIFIKAVCGSRIVAAVRYKSSERSVEIDRLVVLPKYQNLGIGTKLLNEVELRQKDGILIELWTGNKSDRNIHLYKKCGFKIVGKSITSQNIHLLHMSKIIKTTDLCV